MGRGKRSDRAASPRTPADGLGTEERARIDGLVDQRLRDVAQARPEDRYHPPLPSLEKAQESLRIEVAYQLERLSKASLSAAEELVRARFLEAGVLLLGIELVDGRFHAEDRAYVQVQVRYDDLEKAWEVARPLGDEMDPEELSGVMVQCGDLTGEEYLARIRADRTATPA